MVRALLYAHSMTRTTTTAEEQRDTAKSEECQSPSPLRIPAQPQELRSRRRESPLDPSKLRFPHSAGAAFAQGSAEFAAGAASRQVPIGRHPDSELGAPRELVEAEARLVRRLKDRDESAFEELVQGFGGRMLSVARRFLNNEDDARDAVQEAFAASFESITRFNGEARLSTWLHRIVMNAALMQLRRRRRKPEHSIDELTSRLDSASRRQVEDVHHMSAASHVIVEQHETRKMVRRCIAALPESYRVVLTMRDIEEMDSAETAERLGMSPNCVKVRLHRARRALRALIEQEADSTGRALQDRIAEPTVSAA